MSLREKVRRRANDLSIDKIQVDSPKLRAGCLLLGTKRRKNQVWPMKAKESPTRNQTSPSSFRTRSSIRGAPTPRNSSRLTQASLMVKIIRTLLLRESEVGELRSSAKLLMRRHLVILRPNRTLISRHHLRYKRK